MKVCRLLRLGTVDVLQDHYHPELDSYRSRRGERTQHRSPCAALRCRWQSSVSATARSRTAIRSCQAGKLRSSCRYLSEWFQTSRTLWSICPSSLWCLIWPWLSKSGPKCWRLSRRLRTGRWGLSAAAASRTIRCPCRGQWVWCRQGGGSVWVFSRG